MEERALFDSVPIEGLSEWNQRVLLIVAVAFSALSWIAVALRLYTRTFITRSVGWDDAATVVTLVRTWVFRTQHCLIYHSSFTRCNV